MAQMELLQDIQIRKAKGQDNIYYLNDGGGLRLKITPTNSKIWEFRYTYNGKNRKTTFKTYPTVTLKDVFIGTTLVLFVMGIYTYFINN